MKCKNCKAEMELWQTTKIEGQIIKRYRCTCGTDEQVEIVSKPSVKRDKIKK